ncbi:hypothetical protein Bbelb_347860 [Branchiostoma belcheri]|nr:hypothetical protein Bbelb_347860 [Branchiostoma belcheri]
MRSRPLLEHPYPGAVTPPDDPAYVTIHENRCAIVEGTKRFGNLHAEKGDNNANPSREEWNTSSHQTRRTTSHHRDNRMHRRDNKMRRRDNRMRRRDNRMHRRDNRRRRRDNRQRHRDSGPLGRSKRGTSSSGPAAGAGARAAPGGAGGHAEPRCTDRCTPGAYGAVMATPLHVVQELKKQLGAMKQGRTTDIREDLVRYAGRPVEAFDPQGPGPRGGAGSPGKQREPSRERPSQTAG